MNPQTQPAMLTLESAVAEVPGWTPLDQLFALHFIAVTTSGLAGDLLEVGSWCGRSAIALALGNRVAGLARPVHCVDLFPEKDDWYRNADGSYSMRVTANGETIDAYDEQTVWAEPFERDIAPFYERYGSVLQTFTDCTTRAGFADSVHPFKGSLQQFLSCHGADLKCRAVFLDGHHSYRAVVEDIAGIEPRLVPGAWLCFDDAFSGYEGVDRAIRERIIGNPAYDQAFQLTRKMFVARTAQA